jgi:putative NADH-flavin reductase
MKLVVFGATGKTGKHIVQQALDAGHEVIAFARTPSKLGITHERLRVVQGDVGEPEKVESAVAAADAVISVLGPAGRSAPAMLNRGTQNIIAAMKKYGLRRLVIALGAGIGDPNDAPTLVDKLFGTLIRLAAPQAYADTMNTAASVRSSDLEWVIVRVPMLTDDPAKGNVRVGYLGKGVGVRLSRADMAKFMLDEVSASKYPRQAPVISN